MIKIRTSLKGKVAIVTGSAQGIGKVIAEALVRNGAKVVVSDILIEKGRATAKKLGKHSIFIPCDISNASAVNSLVDKTVTKFGKLDIMVNNAGINSSRKEDRVTVDKYPLEVWKRIIAVNLDGTFYCCKAAAIQMVKQKSGNIINIASVAGVVALRLQIGFVAAKAAVIRMTEAMACELAKFGIRVNSVSPGSILTEGTKKLFYSKGGIFKSDWVKRFVPQERPGKAEEIASAVVFLASDSASYINGHNLIIDGGWTSGFNRDF